ncbi:methyltransferase type 11 [Grosmannia clavigera kw1407]|uniref:Methyltransferase type 11 n=1 Tax=Grosmannia clavigera (strain kw1407 / UAMH 11150) TaxID=655863 RepID=F0XDH2_GROCL|nr:methyltransferase type 11 [Grosmannia clavigera kw1407]EFX03822.1 methyltransferase type 11 [Grosmannia clavigera kw1407]
MTTEKQDFWSAEAYQDAAAFVPRLAGKIVGWLDVQKDDVILDIGCGDGVLDVSIGHILAQGHGSVHGIDSSLAMITSAETAVRTAGLSNCTFEVLDANDLPHRPDLLQARFHKAFSNAALHWILRPPDRREAFFRGVRDALQPGGLFAFEMGGLGNVAELVTAVVAAVSRRVGLAATVVADPWFFPDEAWARHMLESRVGGWSVLAAERQWRPTPAGTSGVDGWIRLMARPFLDLIPDPIEREACTREIVQVLEYTTRQPDGSFNLNYVRLRVLARKI